MMTRSLIRGLVVGGLMLSFTNVAVADEVPGTVVQTPVVNTPATTTTTNVEAAKAKAKAQANKAKAQANKAKAQQVNSNDGTSDTPGFEKVTDVADPDDLGSD